jgi:hypothetical protein
VSDGCSHTLNEVLNLWSLASIPTTQKPNAVAKLKSLYDKHAGISRNKSCRSEMQVEIENELWAAAKAV